MTLTKTELAKITKNWVARGTLPPVAAEFHRKNAVNHPNAAEWHNAVADEWERIANEKTGDMIKAYEAVLSYEIDCLANHNPGSELAKYWQDRAAATDKILSGLKSGE